MARWYACPVCMGAAAEERERPYWDRDSDPDYAKPPCPRCGRRGCLPENEMTHAEICEQDTDAAELARLRARVAELEGGLGKAIGLATEWLAEHEMEHGRSGGLAAATAEVRSEIAKRRGRGRG